MCGIAGIIDFEGHAAHGRMLADMTAAIHHRGPDEQKWVQLGHTSLAICRLAIIDPEGSHQPLTNESGDVTLVFNGEIYNYKELRTTLQNAGHDFATNGDGEVIVHGYEEWGTNVFEKLRGMFAVALWDERKHHLVLARDRLGIKPLYTCRTPKRFFFASEIKSILASGEVTAQLRADLMDTYLAFRYVPAPDTLFAGIHKLRPAEFVVLDGEHETRERYHQHVFGPKIDVSEDEAANELGRLLSKSVEYRLQSDVPLGIFLSGGLDSGFLVAMARQHKEGRIDTFSIGFDKGGIYDETKAAEFMSQRFGTTQHSMHMDARSFVARLAESVYYMDEPMADPSAVPMMALSALARQHVTVVLSGEGGDELFGGYPRYIGEAAAARMTVPPRLANAAANLLRQRGLRSKSRGVEGMGIRDEAQRHLFWQTIIRDEARAGLLTGEAANADGALASIKRFSEDARHTAPTGALDRLFYFDLTSWLPEDLLLKKDKMGMSASIEARVPYLDQDVVSYALRLPSSLKVRGLKGKRVLRHLLQKHLPDEILRRPKIGFAVPLADWFRGPLAPILRDELLARDSAFAPYLQQAYVDDMITAHQQGEDLSLALYSLLVLTLWGRIFLGGETHQAITTRMLASIHAASSKV